MISQGESQGTLGCSAARVGNVGPRLQTTKIITGPRSLFTSLCLVSSSCFTGSLSPLFLPSFPNQLRTHDMNHTCQYRARAPPAQLHLFTLIRSIICSALGLMGKISTLRAELSGRSLKPFPVSFTISPTTGQLSLLGIPQRSAQGSLFLASDGRESASVFRPDSVHQRPGPADSTAGCTSCA